MSHLRRTEDYPGTHCGEVAPLFRKATQRGHREPRSAFLLVPLCLLCASLCRY
jgi:hypothetical protein